MILGIGVDVVDLVGFRAQLADSASRFADAVFTDHERAEAASRPSGPAPHLAARWAAKEAFVKAWSSANRGCAPVLTGVDWREIEVRSDRWRRPQIMLHGAVLDAAEGAGVDRIHLSLSHDGAIATAYVVVEGG